ncbi:amidohydrolase family protein [Thalassobacillus pellis]|uniref:amidohydrolase family protein n=1 Tax=Thalassobacillus pellis TaxID=748008 RepID=UPI001961EFB4
MQIFDAHLHIIDPRFPLKKNQGYLPPTFTCADYQKRISHLDVIGGAVVSGSFQAFDQEYLIDALQQLGSGFVGVTQLPPETPDEKILDLNKKGVKAVRFNVKRGGSATLKELERMAKRVYDLARWHVELYIEAKDLAEIHPVLSRLPAVSIDHLGLTKEGFPVLLDLAEKGVKIKATGFGRVELDVCKAIREITAVNPDALMFGTDLPSTRAPRVFQDSDINLIVDAAGEKMTEKIMWGNASAWYQR